MKRRSDTVEVVDDTSRKSMNIGYTGWKVPSDGYEIETISIDDITPVDFYSRYIAKRRPVVIKGFISDSEWKAHEKWTNEYLKQKAGEIGIDVEKRESEKDSFGKGCEVRMKFVQFLELMEKKNYMHYLTTQNVDAKVDGRPNIMAPFMQCLSDDFPNRPELMGNLIPQNINVWMGNNKDGSSSGLHHDYHDNLYLVLRGKKKFRLYSPQDSLSMYTRGKLAQIHPNGRINYENELTTADGADLSAQAAIQASLDKEKAEIALVQAEQDVENNVAGAQERLDQAEEALEKALDDLLNAEFSGGECSGEDDTLGDMYDDDDTSVNIDDEDDTSVNINEDDDTSVDINDDDEEDRVVDKTVKNPPNFSLVDLTLSPEEMALQYPLFLKAKRAHCQVEKGSMLYLPASWFHEVRSHGSDSTGHLAFNYWFHPPDGCQDFSSPYSTDFWSNDWLDRTHKI